MSDETEKIERDLDESRHRLNDTLNQLGRKLSPGQMLDESLGLIRGQAGKAAAGLGRQVLDHPLPVLMIVGGAAWLMTSQGRGRHKTERMETRQGPNIDELRMSTPRLPDESDEAYDQRLHVAYAREHNLEPHAHETREAFTERVKQTARRVRHATAAAGQSVGHAVSGATSGARHAVGNAARAVQTGSRRLGATASDVRHGAQDLYEANPLALGALAFGLGALLGAAMPLSQTERTQFRGIADATARRTADLAEQARSALGEAMH